MKIKTLVFFLIVSGFLQAQQSVNDYKYVIVPNSYSFLNEANEYSLNELSKFLFNKYGFTAFMESDERPKEANENGCLVLHSNVLKEKGLFKTRLKVELKNCEGKVVYTSLMGESREKAYKVAYHEALRNAFASFESLQYAYNEKGSIEVNEIESTPVTEIQEVTKPDLQNIKKEVVTGLTSEALQVQLTQSGFKLLNANKDVAFYAKNTGLQDVYLLENRQGILYKKESKWFLEYYIDGNLVSKALDIKF